MRSAITVSLVPATQGGPFVFTSGLADAFSRAAELGFDAVEIFPSNGDDPALAEVPALCERHGLAVAAIGTGAGWVVQKLTLTHADAAVREKARAFIRRIVERAAGFGAPAIIGSMQGRVERGVAREQALAWLGEGLTEIGGYAATLGVPLLYEPLNRYETNLFNRVGDTAAWLKTLKTANVKILADLFHMNIEEADTAAALREAGAAVGHVHFADSNRRAIGLGQTRIAPIVAALREMDYRGYLSAEIFPLPSAEVAATQTIKAFREYVKNSGSR